MRPVDATNVREAESGGASVVEQVSVTLRRKILDGSLRPGQAFSLRRMAKDLGVSFIPIREALRVLEGQGLVIAAPGKSATVAPLTYEDLDGIYRLRLRIEPDLAYRSCELLTKEDIAHLHSLARQMGDERYGIDEIYDAHDEFHMRLLRPAATDWDDRVLSSLWHAAERYVRLAFGKLDSVSGEHERREASHTSLLNVFISRDPAAAAVALRGHLEENERLASRALAEIVL